YLDFDRELLDRLIPQRFCEWKGLRVNCGPRGFPHVSGALFRNRGDFRFEDVTRAAGLEIEGSYQLGVVFSDLDGDGDSDLYLATDSTPNLLFANRGDGTFEDRSLLSGAAFSHAGSAQAGMGVDAGDVDGDGKPDLAITNFSDDYNTIYLNQGGLLFLDATDLLGLAVASLPYLGWSAFLEDLDADSDLDFFVVNGHVYPQVDGSGSGETFRQPMQLFWNDRGTGFREARSDVLKEPRASRGAALGDLDFDTDPDIVVNVMDSEPVVLENRSERGFVSLSLAGRKSNREGIGAKVWGESSGREWLREIRRGRGYLSSSEPAARFAVVSRVVVEWPSGMRDEIGALGLGHHVLLEGVGIVYETE
ncbi:MAG: CRTAC1 family protein, partial [Vicinamibacteria bacterium]